MAPTSTSLHEACIAGDASLVAGLLAGGADVEKRDNYGATGLHLATKAGSRECIICLLQAGADVNAAEGRQRWTPLHLAVYHGREQLVPLLLAAGASLDRTDVSERTPWMLAERSGKEELGRLLKMVRALQHERAEAAAWLGMAEDGADAEAVRARMAALARQAAALQRERDEAQARAGELAQRASSLEQQLSEARSLLHQVAMQQQQQQAGASGVQGRSGGAVAVLEGSGPVQALAQLQREMGEVVARLAALEEQQAVTTPQGGTFEQRSPGSPTSMHA